MNEEKEGPAWSKDGGHGMRRYIQTWGIASGSGSVSVQYSSTGGMLAGRAMCYDENRPSTPTPSLIVAENLAAIGTAMMKEEA